MKIALIPARGGSKSIPLKNIKMFCGKPLIYWNLKALEDSCIDEIYVATDSKEIKEVVNSFNFSKVFVYDRDPQNAQNTSSTESVLLEFIANKNIAKDAYLCLVQLTSPLTRTEDFNNAFKQLIATGYDSLLTAVLSKRFFWHKNSPSTPINYDYLSRPRRQDFDGYYMENGAFYINKVANILEHKNRICGKISIYEMPEYMGIEIDEAVDWIIAEKLMETYNLQKSKE
ncbi:MAG: acylneuraminate cytidylyltransferase family protein [Alphaproteobacteria bacterium]|jgi:N-acylneuraminate cytidylyltransferase|nr:acylneuraminate cytidylyltransferase family protein [Alphaproteobacteria bacterium]